MAYMEILARTCYISRSPSMLLQSKLVRTREQGAQGQISVRRTPHWGSRAQIPVSRSQSPRAHQTRLSPLDMMKKTIRMNKLSSVGLRVTQYALNVALNIWASALPNTFCKWH